MILPLKQNQLDGLCGLMSAVNALRFLFPDCLGDEEDPRTQELVSKLVDFINSKQFDAFSYLWKNGCERDSVLSFLDFFKSEGFYFEVYNLGNRIKKTDEEGFWLEAREWLDEQSIIIAGFCDPDPHWTCIKHISQNTLYHFDSSVYVWTSISDTDTIHDKDDDWFFNRKDIFLIRRL